MSLQIRPAADQLDKRVWFIRREGVALSLLKLKLVELRHFLTEIGTGLKTLDIQDSNAIEGGLLVGSQPIRQSDRILNLCEGEYREGVSECLNIVLLKGNTG